MSPEQFENHMEHSVREFDEVASRATEIGKPARAKEFFDRARTYESILKVYREIDHVKRAKFVVMPAEKIRNGTDFSNY